MFNIGDKVEITIFKKFRIGTVIKINQGKATPMITVHREGLKNPTYIAEHLCVPALIEENK